MALYTYVNIQLPEAHDLADLVGISTDFTRASDMADFILRALAEDPPKFHLIEAYSIAIAVVYSRPFMSGIRRRLVAADIDAILDSKEREAHDRLRAYRDMHFAHAINNFEVNTPRAHYWEGGTIAEMFTAISYSSEQVSGMSRQTLQSVVSLCEKFGDYIHSKMRIEEDMLLKIVRSMDVQKVLAWGKQTSFEGSANPRKHRKQRPTKSAKL